MNDYILYIHTQNVLLGTKHSGFQFGIPTENGMVYHTIDLSQNSAGKIEFKYDSYIEGETVPFIERAQIATSSDAIAAYNKLMIATSMINLFSSSLDYGLFTQNCNGSTAIFAERFFPQFANNGSGIFNDLSGPFIGDEANSLTKNTDFMNALYWAEKLIFEIGYNIDDGLLDITKFDDYILVSDGDSVYKLDNQGRLWLQDDDGEFQTFLSRAFNQCLIPFDTLFSVSSLYQTAEVQTSPLIVDLDGDGVETMSVANGIYFDHDGNGFAENTGWVGKDDGLLVRDINGNGQIDNGTELFGNNSVLSNGQKAANGFEALKDLDSNNDGVFNNQDTAWNEVKVWKDSNSNGIVDEGELLTMEQAGITGFDLNYQSQSRDDANGNAHLQTSTITKADGTTADITDVWFKTDYLVA